MKLLISLVFKKKKSDLYLMKIKIGFEFRKN